MATELWPLIASDRTRAAIPPCSGRRHFHKFILATGLASGLHFVRAQRVLAGPQRRTAEDIVHRAYRLGEQLRRGQIGPGQWQDRIEALVDQIDLTELVTAIDLSALLPICTIAVARLRIGQNHGCNRADIGRADIGDSRVPRCAVEGALPADRIESVIDQIVLYEGRLGDGPGNAAVLDPDFAAAMLGSQSVR